MMEKRSEMFGATTGGVEIDGVHSGTVTVSLTAAKTETLMGLQGRFAASDTMGNLNLLEVTAGAAVQSMVIGGGFSGGAFVLSGSGVEIGGGGVILTATYQVSAKAPGGTYTIPVTIEAATVDGVPIEDEAVTATVNVAVREVAPEPVAEPETPTPAPAPTESVSQNVPEQSVNEATTGGETVSADETDFDGGEDKETASEAEAKSSEGDEAAKMETKVPKAEAAKGANEDMVLTAFADETGAETTGADGGVIGIVLGVVALVAVVGAVVGLLIYKFKKK